MPVKLNSPIGSFSGEKLIYGDSAASFGPFFNTADSSYTVVLTFGVAL